MTKPVEPPDSVFICEHDFEDENKVMRAPVHDCDIEYVRADLHESLREQLEAAQKECETHKLLRDEAHNTYDSAMIALGDILGIDVRDEPRCKWVSLQASKIMRQLAQSEADARRYRWLREYWFTPAANRKSSSIETDRHKLAIIACKDVVSLDAAIDAAIAAEGAGEEGNDK